jgi:hypothetical protein
MEPILYEGSEEKLNQWNMGTNMDKTAMRIQKT